MNVPIETESNGKSMSDSGPPVEIRLRGRWVAVPSLEVNGEKLICTGKWLRIAKVRSEEMREYDLVDPAVYVDALKDNAGSRLNAHIFTFTQKPPDTDPKYRYYSEPESLAAIRLVSFKKWWDDLPQETRKNVRRSQRRGVTVTVREFEDDVIQGIREVNDDSPVRQGMRNGYYGKSVEETKKLYGEFIGRCDFVCAYFEGKMIGFLHLVYRGEIASILNLTTKPSHFDKRPANALMARAVELCEEKGLRCLTYGLYNYGKKRDHPLRTFKIRNGFEEILIPRFFVPLNGWGRLWMTAKLHRGLIGILPESIIKIVPWARSQWYRFAHPTSRCSSTPERPNSDREMECSSPPAGSNV